MLTRQGAANLYRPVGPKIIQSGIAFSSGGSVNLTGQVDLSLPIEGFRLVFKFRDVIAGADMTSVKPEGWLNLIKNIRITGTNSRQNGNATLWDIDLATLWGIQHLLQPAAAQLNGYNATANAEYPNPTTPFAPMMIVTQGTYDVRIVVDLPAYPFMSPPGQRPGFFIRQSEWKDSLQLQLQFGTVIAAGGGTDCLGVEAAGTTHLFTGYGAGTGSGTVDLYSLPCMMGINLKDQVVPGFVTRVQQPISTILQSAGSSGTGVTLLNLEKQNTSRIFFKIGVSAAAQPAFSSLSDSNVTALGVYLGGNRTVRETDDLFAHKQDIVRRYGVKPIQGYNCLDFIQSGNPDSGYPGDTVGDGTTLQLRGNVTGVANAYGIVIQEQMLYRPEGALYSF